MINADSEELQLAPAEFGSVDLHMPVGPGRSEPVLYLLILPPYQIRQFNLSYFLKIQYGLASVLLSMLA